MLRESLSQSCPLRLEPHGCAVCGRTDGQPVGLGEDFEYRTSPDTFLALRCQSCGLVYLDPRPAESEMSRIYPDDYHAFDFNAETFGLVYRIRGKLESRRVLRALAGIPDSARVIDVGCGDGFHLDLLRLHGPTGWRLEGVDADERAVAAAGRRGLVVHHGTLESQQFSTATFDAAILIQTIEHLSEPRALLEEINRILAPGGRLLIVTDNTDSPDFRLFGSRFWGGYHFPRHLSLFNKASLTRLTESVGFETRTIATIVSPVNWVYSIRNWLDDHHAPGWMVNQFSLSSAPSLAVFTMFDGMWTVLKRGALLRAVVVKRR